MNNRLKNINLGGFSTVELIITLFVASIFLVAGYQLYSVIIKDGGETRLQAKAGNLAYDYLQQYKIKAKKNNCEDNLSSQPPANIVPTTEEAKGLPGAKVKVEYSCPTKHYYFDAKYYNGQNFDAGGSISSQNVNEYAINHRWGSTSPMPGITADNFSATWDGYFTVPETANYIFRVENDDAIDLKIKESSIPIFEHTNTYSGGVAIVTTATMLYSTKTYKMSVRFIEKEGDSTIRIEWKKSSDPDTAYKLFTPNSGTNFTNETADLTKVLVTVTYGTPEKKAIQATYVNKQ